MIYCYFLTTVTSNKENLHRKNMKDQTVAPSPGNLFPCIIPKGDTNKTTTYDQEMSYGQTVKPPYTAHNVAH